MYTKFVLIKLWTWIATLALAMTNVMEHIKKTAKISGLFVFAIQWSVAGIVVVIHHQ